MLLERDISNFNPRILPSNNYLEQLQENTIDSVQKFIEQVDAGEYSASVLYRMYKDYCIQEEYIPYSNTKFSTQLLYFTTNGCITRDIVKVKTKKSNNYTIN